MYNSVNVIILYDFTDHSIPLFTYVHQILAKQLYFQTFLNDNEPNYRPLYHPLLKHLPYPTASSKLILYRLDFPLQDINFNEAVNVVFTLFYYPNCTQKSLQNTPICQSLDTCCIIRDCLKTPL